MTPAAMVREFHEAFGVEIRDTPGIPANEVEVLRYELIAEEAAEVADAIVRGDLVDVAHELADLLYVTYGTALAYGIPLDDVVAEVHRANLSKTGEKRADGKVTKAGYVAPDVAGVLGL